MSSLFESVHWLSLTSYSLLIASMLLLWSPYQRSAIGTFIVAVALSVAAGHIGLPAIGVVVALAGAMYGLRWQERRASILRFGFHGVLVLSALALFSHYAPGFENLKLLEGMRLSPASLPYSFYLNFDKPLFGFLFLLVSVSRAGTWAEWRPALRWGALCAFATAAVLLAPAVLLNHVRWEPKAPFFWPLWILSQLLVTCLAEEAFFRGYLLRRWAADEWNVSETRPLTGRVLMAWLASSLMFGLAHFPGGPTYVALSTIAGLFYGFAYLKSGRIEAAILAHFGVNAIHFFLFTYPALS